MYVRLSTAWRIIPLLLCYSVPDIHLILNDVNLDGLNIFMTGIWLVLWTTKMRQILSSDWLLKGQDGTSCLFKIDNTLVSVIPIGWIVIYTVGRLENGIILLSL